MLAPLGRQVIAQRELGVAAAAETGATFAENALLKARHACIQTGLPALADDSGLEVDALGGAPGIYSARYAGANATDADNRAQLLKNLIGVPLIQRTARFHCALVFLTRPDAQPQVCLGSWEGRIIDTPTGANGFGYDPVFFVAELNQTAAQLSPPMKNQRSHRAQALRQLKQFL